VVHLPLISKAKLATAEDEASRLKAQALSDTSALVQSQRDLENDLRLLQEAMADSQRVHEEAKVQSKPFYSWSDGLSQRRP
jgi:hypothetical protein